VEEVGFNAGRFPPLSPVMSDNAKSVVASLLVNVRESVPSFEVSGLLPSVAVMVIVGEVVSDAGTTGVPLPPPPLQPAMTREKEVKTSRETIDRFIRQPPRENPLLIVSLKEWNLGKK
jgi:hypothetical protein